MNQPNEHLPDVEPEAPVDYHGDVIAWANHQAALLRAGQFDQLDIENIAEEIESVARHEQRELRNRLIVLVMHLLKQQYQPERKPNSSWEATIRVQRKDLRKLIKKVPSLKPTLDDPDFIETVWDNARVRASDETGLIFEIFSEECPYDFHQVIYDEDEQ